MAFHSINRSPANTNEIDISGGDYVVAGGESDDEEELCVGRAAVVRGRVLSATCSAGVIAPKRGHRERDEPFAPSRKKKKKKKHKSGNDPLV